MMRRDGAGRRELEAFSKLWRIERELSSVADVLAMSKGGHGDEPLRTALDTITGWIASGFLVTQTLGKCIGWTRLSGGRVECYERGPIV